MKVTAKEAAAKRCQEGFASGPVANFSGSIALYSASYHAQPTSPMFCIAGGCMAWRWSDKCTIDGELLGYCGKARHRD